MKPIEVPVAMLISNRTVSQGRPFDLRVRSAGVVERGLAYVERAPASWRSAVGARTT
jgi:hypothetical protein